MRPDDWAREYYSGKAQRRVSPTDIEHVMRTAAGQPQSGKEGMPEGIPRPLVTPEGAELGDFLAACRQATADGHGMAALVALKVCLILDPDQPLPPWLRATLVTSINGWCDHTWATLEEAFQAKRPRAKSPDAKFRYTHSTLIWQDVTSAKRAGVAIDRELFDEIARRYACSFATVERIWGEFQGLTKDPTMSTAEPLRDQRFTD